MNYVQLRDRFRDPYIQTVSYMALSEIGIEAEAVDRKMQSWFRGDSPHRAEMILDGLVLRTSRNYLRSLSPQASVSLAQELGVAGELDEYHCLERVYAMRNELLYKQSSLVGLPAFVERHGFMPAVMALVEAGNSVLRDSVRGHEADDKSVPMSDSPDLPLAPINVPLADDSIYLALKNGEIELPPAVRTVLQSAVSLWEIEDEADRELVITALQGKPSTLTESALTARLAGYSQWLVNERDENGGSYGPLAGLEPELLVAELFRSVREERMPTATMVFTDRGAQSFVDKMWRRLVKAYPELSSFDAETRTQFKYMLQWEAVTGYLYGNVVSGLRQ